MNTTAACRLTGRSRATHYRRRNPPAPRERAPRPTPPSALSPAERAEVLAVLNQPQYADLPPAQVWARELDEGRYWCSERTMYRILAAAGQSGERRRLAAHPAKKVPQLVASAPCQVLTWDISKLKGPDKGVWYHLYVIIDIYSRYICGWTVERAESAERAEELIRETIERNGIVPETVHADRGTSMTSKKVSQLLIDLGVARSHSRPKVSNDNPFSEANFKTIKYCGEYPESFNSLTEVRDWCESFIACYNHEKTAQRHRHAHAVRRPLRPRRTAPRDARRRPGRRLRQAPRTLRPQDPRTPETARGHLDKQADRSASPRRRDHSTGIERTT
ncbi:DDE-type integrase/transposase/recombinase [Streptomyces sp. NPDC048430]|uniref:DDE-type integrase/transposase/recombinase n=1 Tax=Streptomyces sp. NPDC048430 TaxID=3155388 RepID=UPI003417E8AE